MKQVMIVAVAGLSAIFAWKLLRSIRKTHSSASHETATDHHLWPSPLQLIIGFVTSFDSV